MYIRCQILEQYCFMECPQHCEHHLLQCFWSKLYPFKICIDILHAKARK